MDTAKKYHDSYGNECSIWQVVKREPEWAAVRIQEGEKAIEELKILKEKNRKLLFMVEHGLGFEDLVNDI